MPLTTIPRIVDSQGDARAPECGGLYRAIVSLAEEPADTFLDMTGWKKGYVWVNGHLLGRYWNIGPQERLYCPAEFLRKGNNAVEVLDLYIDSDTPPSITGKTERNMEVKKQTKALNNQWD